MKYLGLKAVIRRKKYKKEIKDTSNPFKNIINRDFSTKSISKKWFTDVIYIPIKDGLLYLSIVIDTFNNEVISWVISKNNDLTLVMNTFNPLRSLMMNSKNLIIHSDRGHQYNSHKLGSVIV